MPYCGPLCPGLLRLACADLALAAFLFPILCLTCRPEAILKHELCERLYALPPQQPEGEGCMHATYSCHTRLLFAALC